MRLNPTRPASRKSQLIGFLLATLFLLAAPLTSFQPVNAQTTNTKPQAPAKSSEAAGKKPDYSQESVIVEYRSMAYRFERDGTGQYELRFRGKIQTDAAVEQFGQLVFGY